MHSLTSSTQVRVCSSPSDGDEGAQVTGYSDYASVSQTGVDVSYKRSGEGGEAIMKLIR